MLFCSKEYLSVSELVLSDFVADVSFHDILNLLQGNLLLGSKLNI